MSAVWRAIGGAVRPFLIGGTLVRTVESQTEIATLELVDGDLEAQDTLERLLERSKPPRRPGTESLDYLLATPWRYPPLRYGSRFGSRAEPSLFYGSLSVDTSLAETAYYRWLFLADMGEVGSPVITRHTVLEAKYRTERGVRLQSAPFDAHAETLAHRADYTETQALGRRLREAGVEAFEFVSARDPQRGINVALVSPAALRSERHERPRDWLCTTVPAQVTFRAVTRPSELVKFAIEDFAPDGVLPRPAP